MKKIDADGELYEVACNVIDHAASAGLTFDQALKVAELVTLQQIANELCKNTMELHRVGTMASNIDITLTEWLERIRCTIAYLIDDEDQSDH